MLRAAFLAGLAGLLVASPAIAQPRGEQPDNENDSSIVVTGELPTQQEVTRQARDITVPIDIRDNPLPRFEDDPLCPGIVGLPVEFAAPMIARIRATAESLRLKMTEDDGSCQANFIVAFVDDGQDIMQQIAERWPERFKGMERPERLALLAEDGPARVWTSTETLSRDGVPVSEDRITGAKHASSPVATRIGLATREDITGVLVLFDRAKANGKTVFQLADYATMRGLARTRPVGDDGQQAMDTILALFDPGSAPPGEMTAFDHAYLSSLYSGMPNASGLSKVIGVRSQLGRQAQAEQRASGGDARQ